MQTPDRPDVAPIPGTPALSPVVQFRDPRVQRELRARLDQSGSPLASQDEPMHEGLIAARDLGRDAWRGDERDDLNGHGSDHTRPMQEAIDWSVVQHGGRALGPFSPMGLVQAWQFYRWRGREVSMYAITAHGRTVYLPSSSGDHVPRGMRIQAEQVWLDGLDERGRRVSLRRMACAEVNCYLFLTNSPDLLA